MPASRQPRPKKTQPAVSPPSIAVPAGFLSRYGWWIALALILAVVTWIRIRLLAMPLERDEGEYAYAGQLLLQGVPPYQDLYSMKWPGTFFAYAVILALFGQSIVAIHLGLLLVTLFTAVMVFVMVTRDFGPRAAFVAAGTFSLLSLTPASFGLAAHATHFLILFAIAGLLLLRASNKKPGAQRLFVVGLLLGTATLMKQAGAAFGLLAVLWFFWRELQESDRDWGRFLLRFGSLVAGGVLPLVLLALFLSVAGVLGHFWLWTFKYAGAYVGLNSVSEGLRRLMMNGGRLVQAAPGIWSLAAAGLLLLFCTRDLRKHCFWVTNFGLFSFIAVCPGGYFRGHYFLVLFPALGLLAGIAVEAGGRLLERLGSHIVWKTLPVAIFIVASAWFLYGSRAIFFELPPVQACRAIYGLNPFPESVEIGRYLEAQCSPENRIAVIGSEPQIYFYSRRRAATGYVYTYPLLERQPYAKMMQREMEAEVTKADPAYIVFVSQPSSWGPQDTSDFSIIEWFIQYKQDHLEPVGCVDIFPDGRTEYSWSAANPRSDQWMQIYRKTGK